MRDSVFMVLFLTACSFDVDTAHQTGALGAEGGLRIMAANLSSGTRQNYDAGEGIRILQATDADVVLIQELNYGDNSPAAIRQLVDTAFDPSFAYYRESGAQIPNGIISRYPIVAAGEWDDPYLLNRDFAWARIDVPGPRDLWAVSVHLYAQSATTRDYEAASLVAYVRANVPEEDYLVIGGDLNTGSRSELAFTTLSQIVGVAGPYPVDQAGNANTNTTRYRPYDHVLTDADLTPVPTLIGASTFEAGLVLDTRVYAPIEELWPAVATDSAAPNMQHMAVIRDFVLPEEEEVFVGTPHVFINEILANELGTDASREHVELLNTGTGAANLGGWTISDSYGLRYTFPANTQLEPGRAHVVVAPLGLNNSTDTVTVRDATGAVVDTFTYSASLASYDGVSMNRSPDGAFGAPFILHTQLSYLPSSAGTRVDGTQF